MTITVNRVGGTAGEVSVQVAVSPGTALLGSDYDAASGTFRWADGDPNLTRTFNIAILDDALAEGSETVNLTLSNPTGGAILGSPTAATLTITDNDAPPAGALVFGSPAYTVGENGGQVTVTVNRVGGSAGEVTAQFTTADGSATAGSDYTAVSKTLTWTNGIDGPQTIVIPILDDALVEGGETVNLTLGNLTGGAVLGLPATAVLTITDNDTGPPPPPRTPQPSLVGGRTDGTAVVAAGDVTGDGSAELAFGGGPDGAPRVRLFDGKQLLAAGGFASLDGIPAAQRANFFAGGADLRGGVRLALRDVDADGRADLVIGSGEGEPSRVRVYKAGTLLAGGSPSPDQEIDPFAGIILTNGVFVG